MPEDVMNPVTTPSSSTGQPEGLLEPGNLNINGRPSVPINNGYDEASEYSTSFGDDKGREILVPTIVNGKFLTPNGSKPQVGSPEESAMFKRAQQHYEDTHEHLGIFSSPADADAYAQTLHNRNKSASGASYVHNTGPTTVQYPSGHTVQFPTEHAAAKHSASVWNQLKDEWNTVKNWQGVEGPDGEDRKTGADASPLGQSIIDKVKDWHKAANDTLDEAGVSLGRLPAEVLSGAKNFQAYMPSPYGQKPSMESVESTAKREHPTLSGVGEGVGRFTGSMLAPENVAIMATMPYAKAVPLLTRGLSVAFGAGMTKGVVDDAKNIVANWPKMTPQQRTSALTSGSLQTVMAGLAVMHAVGGEGKSVIPAELKSESGEMVIPGTGGQAGTVGSADAAAKDTQYFKEAKEENPDASFSDWARIAQEKKAAGAKATDLISGLGASGRRVTPRETPERRVDSVVRKRIADMSHEELRQELLTSKTTGSPNRRAFEESEHIPAKAVAVSDADGLKALNDKFGYAAGDALLKAKAEALKEVGLDAYHDKGDEFLYRGESSESLQQKLEKARDILRNREIQVDFKDGTTRRFKGADFSYGTGTDLTKAEDGLKGHKAEREARGERARGELRGISEIKSQTNQGSKSSTPVIPSIDPTSDIRKFYHGANAEGTAAIERIGKLSPTALTQAHLTPSRATAEAYAKANGGKVYAVKAGDVPTERLSQFDKTERGPIVIRHGDEIPVHRPE